MLNKRGRVRDCRMGLKRGREGGRRGRRRGREDDKCQHSLSLLSAKGRRKGVSNLNSRKSWRETLTAFEQQTIWFKFFKPPRIYCPWLHSDSTVFWWSSVLNSLILTYSSRLLISLIFARIMRVLRGWRKSVEEWMSEWEGRLAAVSHSIHPPLQSISISLFHVWNEPGKKTS